MVNFFGRIDDRYFDCISAINLILKSLHTYNIYFNVIFTFIRKDKKIVFFKKKHVAATMNKKNFLVRMLSTQLDLILNPRRGTLT